MDDLQARQEGESTNLDPPGLGVAVAAVRGDPEAMRALWREHRRWVAAVLMAHKPREVDVDDLLQDVAMTLVRSIGQLRDPGVVKPWLRTVAINAARAAGRTARRRRSDGGTEELETHAPVATIGPGPRPEPAPADTDGAGERGGRIMDLATRLPEGYREPLLLKTVRGLSYRQIGALMGLPETTIETRIARARRMLRELATGAGLSPEGGDEQARAAKSGRGRES